MNNNYKINKAIAFFYYRMTSALDVVGGDIADRPVSIAPDAITPVPDHDHRQLLSFTIALHLWTDKYHRLQKHIFQSQSGCCPGTDGNSLQGPIPGPYNIYNGKPCVYPAVPFL